MRTFFLAASLAVLAGGACLATPADIWPVEVKAYDASSLAAEITRIGTAKLPEELRPAADYEAAFLRIISGAPQTAWLPDIQRFARLEGEAPLKEGVRNASQTWLARVAMEAINAALVDFYAENVRFPNALDELKLPVDLQKDPWGDEWSYTPRLAGQRYELGPKRLPHLKMLKAAIHDRAAPGRDWKIALRDIAGRKAIEFRRLKDDTVLATLEEGGKLEDCALLFIGENWVLMAGQDQLFALTF